MYLVSEINKKKQDYENSYVLNNYFFRFGILALDEPTTNLDQDNIKSLCAALADIVQERRKQKNFMFIIITHDKEFIQALGNVDKVTHFYEVSRNDDGKSRIKKIRFI